MLLLVLNAYTTTNIELLPLSILLLSLLPPIERILFIGCLTDTIKKIKEYFVAYGVFCVKVCM